MPGNPLDAKAIFNVARRIDCAEARAEYLRQVSGGDAGLVSRVTALLQGFEQHSSFLESPAMDGAATIMFESCPERPGTQIGPYKLLEQIGTGGMGAVYVAEQKEPVRRKVALKVIKPGMDTRQVVARFEAERQALALMNHPNIAKVLDAGATDAGRPYFVMELVKGAPITEFCDQQKLDTRERLQLFITVCQAVQHAHQKGLIHRDIKPSNVLVEMHDVLPVPKVIDFGVAKAIGQSLTDKTLHTGFDQMVGTPLYMSPEQAGQSSIDVDTRSDVYSLGVLLYEILTGHTPFERDTLRDAGFDEMRRMIREVDPPRPSARVSTLEAKALSTVSECRKIEPHRLSQQFRGELDWIVMKALEKDRNRRYESTIALAADVQRYLNDEPVEACPPSAGYRFRKFARKNRVPLTTAAIVAATLLIGTAVSAWQAVRATQAHTQANANETQALAAATAERAAKQSESLHRQRAEASAKQAKDRLVEVERQRTAASQNLYFSDLRLGLVDWNAGNVARLSGKLLSHVPQAGADDLRGWEWYYLFSLCHQDERTLMHHSREVFSVAWSPDGRCVASTGQEGKVCVYDSTSWRLLRTWSGEFARGACWSPDSRQLTWGTTADDSGVYAGAVETGEIKCLRGHTSSVWTTAWSPNGKYLASAGIDHTIRVWDAATGSCLNVIEGIGGNVESVAWHPDGKFLAVGESSQFSIWDGLSGELLQSVLTPGDSMSLAWSPDGKQLAMGTTTGLCLVYRTPDWSLASRWEGHTGFVNCVAWNRKGNQLASTGADGLIKVWDAGNGNVVLTLRGHLGQVKSVAWEPNGRHLISAGMDGLVKVWPLPPAPYPRHLQAHSGGVLDIAWGEEPDTLRSVGTADGMIRAWNIVSGQSLAKVPLAADSSGQFSTGRRLLGIVTAAETQPEVRIHDARSGEWIQTVTTGLVPVSFSAVSPNGSRLALTSPWRLEVVDVAQNQVCFHRDVYPNAPCWSPDGRLLAVAGYGEAGDGGDLQWAGWVYVFDVEKHECVMKVQHGTSRVKATAVTWSPDGKRLASGNINGLAEVWEVATGRRIVSAQLHTATIDALAWSPDGLRVASASGDGTVRVWDPASGEELLKLDASQAEVTHLRWSPDGRRLAAAAADGAIDVWDATAGYEYAQTDEYQAERVHKQLSHVTERWESGRHEEALAVFEQTVEESKTRLTLAPWVVRSLRSQARAADVACRYPDAITFFQLSLRLNKDDVGALESLAWLLATCPDLTLRDPKQAVQLAQQALTLAPLWPDVSKTLGVAHYRSGDWKAAVTALEKSIELRQGGDSFDWFFLAMAHWQLGDKEQAQKWYDQAVAWMDTTQPQNEELLRFRAEAVELLKDKSGDTDRK